VAFTQAVTLAHDDHTPRVIGEDVIINLISGAPTVTKNKLCVTGMGAVGDAAYAKPRCFDSVMGSVGIAGWAISCWPFESQISWAPDSKTIAYTYTNTTLVPLAGLRGWYPVRAWWRAIKCGGEREKERGWLHEEEWGQ